MEGSLLDLCAIATAESGFMISNNHCSTTPISFQHPLRLSRHLISQTLCKNPFTILKRNSHYERREENPMAGDTWRSIFAQSPVNRGYYTANELPHCAWNWPKATWFQARRNTLRERQPVWSHNMRRLREVSALQSLDS
jgi:hypothetical protein